MRSTAPDQRELSGDQSDPRGCGEGIERALTQVLRRTEEGPFYAWVMMTVTGYFCTEETRNKTLSLAIGTEEDVRRSTMALIHMGAMYR